MLLNISIFKALLCCCKTDTGVYCMVGMGNLGTDAEGVECVGRVVTCTLGDSATGAVCAIEIGSTLLSCVASANNAFLTESPAARLGVVVDGGRVRILMMSPATCFRWSVSLTSKNGVDVEKNVAVSQSLGVLVRENSNGHICSEPWKGRCTSQLLHLVPMYAGH